MLTEAPPSLAIDFGGLALGLDHLEREFGECTAGVGGHITPDARDFQELLLGWARDNWRHSLTMDWPVRAVVGQAVELNRFVRSEGLVPTFGAVPGLGLATLTRITPEWSDDVKAYQDFVGPGLGKRYNAAHLTGPGVMCYRLPDSKLPLVSIRLQDRLNLWLFQPPSFVTHSRELALLADRVAQSTLEPESGLDAVVVPLFKLRKRTTLDQLQGMGTGTGTTFQCLTNVMQWCQIDMGTWIGRSRPQSSYLPQAVFDGPFCGYFTLDGEPRVPFGRFQVSSDMWINTM